MQAVCIRQETLLASSAFEKDLVVATDNHFNMSIQYYTLAKVPFQQGAIHRLKLPYNLDCTGKAVIRLLG